MARHTLTLGRLFGIRVGVHASWFAVYAFVTIAIARARETPPPPAAYAFGAVCALALFASVVAHELAHALVARRFGVRTGAITLFLFGGVATLDEEPPTPRADALVALAGPAMSAVLAFTALFALFALERFAHGGAGETAARLDGYVAVANGVLAIFNLIPAYPMDGGRVLRAIVWTRTRDRDTATAQAARVGMVLALVLVSAGVLAAAALQALAFAWYAVLGMFLLRQSWSQERTFRPRRAVVAAVAHAEVPA